MVITERDRRALLLGGVGLALIIAYFAVIEPGLRGYDGLVAEHRGLAARVARVGHDQRKAEYFAERIAAFEQSSGELADPKPYAEQVTGVAERIMQAAGQSGLQLRSSRPAAPVPWPADPSLALANINLEAELGWQNAPQAAQPWENVFKFIANLNRIPGVLSVERLELNSDAGLETKPLQPGRLTVRMTVSVLTKAATEGPRWAR